MFACLLASLIACLHVYSLACLLVCVGKETVSESAGSSFFHSADSFAMIRFTRFLSLSLSLLLLALSLAACSLSLSLFLILPTLFSGGHVDLTILGALQVSANV